MLHEETGLRVDGDSLGAIVSGLRGMVENERLGLHMGDVGRLRVLEQFSWDAVASKTRGV